MCYLVGKENVDNICTARKSRPPRLTGLVCCLYDQVISCSQTKRVSANETFNLTEEARLSVPKLAY